MEHEKLEQERMTEAFLEEAELLEEEKEQETAEPGSAAPPAREPSFVYRVREHYGVLSREKDGWCKELNLVSWNNGPDKFDIRSWDHLHRRKTKGITLWPEEVENLYRILDRMYGRKEAEMETRQNEN